MGQRRPRRTGDASPGGKTGRHQRTSTQFTGGSRRNGSRDVGERRAPPASKRAGTRIAPGAAGNRLLLFVMICATAAVMRLFGVEQIQRSLRPLLRTMRKCQAQAQELAAREFRRPENPVCER